MTIEQAWQALSLAGRQLSGGPNALLLDIAAVDMAVERLGAVAHIETLRNMGVKNESCAPIALGIILGQIMQEDASTQAELHKIEKEWVASPAFMRDDES